MADSYILLIVVPHKGPSLAEAFAIAVLVIGVAFALLSEARSTGLDPGSLAVRAALVITGIGACRALCLQRDHLRKLFSLVEGVVRPGAERNGVVAKRPT